MREEDFNRHYAVTVMKPIGHYGRKIPVVVAGKNEAELHARIKGKMLRRRQRDVGIRPPINDLLPIAITAAERRQVDGDIDRAAVLAAAESGDTNELELHLGRLRHITGDIKAHGIVRAASDYFERMPAGEKLVIMYWHRSTGDILAEGLQKFMPLRLDGSTPAQHRGGIVEAFRLPKHQLYLGQIEASGEGIDLSASSELWFAESVFSPRSMKQASLRIANLNQPKQTLVRVATLEGSIDEAVQARLIKLWATISQVLGDN
jgi:SNF2 family DNA or RNA helicase